MSSIVGKCTTIQRRGLIKEDSTQEIHLSACHHPRSSRSTRKCTDCATPTRQLFPLLFWAWSLISTTAAFSRQHANRITKLCRTSLASAPPSNAEDLFASDGWKPIKKDLDQVPVFTCANEKGKPLMYTIDMPNDETFQVPFFYCDVEDAKVELEKSRENTGLSGLDLVPYPLGVAFQMWAKDEAVIVPNKEAILQAGAPPGTNPIGQQIPLFACMSIMQESQDGKGVLPLFLTLNEANDAVRQAVAIDGGNGDEFEVVSLSLQRAVEQLATIPETPAFQFIPPRASIQFIQNYLSSS